jgi:hypothetical protein
MNFVYPWIRIDSKQITLRFTTCIHYIKDDIFLFKILGFGFYKDLK